jgi:hypothetical protein
MLSPPFKRFTVLFLLYTKEIENTGKNQIASIVLACFGVSAALFVIISDKLRKSLSGLDAKNSEKRKNYIKNRHRRRAA